METDEAFAPDEALASDVFDESYVRDNDGRIVPARRPQPPPYASPATPQHHPSQTSPSTPQLSPPQISPPQQQPIPQQSSTSPVDAMVLRPSTSRQLFTSEPEYGRGRGKAGHKMIIQKNKLIQANDSKEQKAAWNTWKTEYADLLRAEIKNKRLHEHLPCKRCNKIIDKNSYLNHNIKNCKSLHPNMKWANFRANFQ